MIDRESGDPEFRSSFGLVRPVLPDGALGAPVNFTELQAERRRITRYIGFAGESLYAEPYAQAKAFGREVAEMVENPCSQYIHSGSNEIEAWGGPAYCLPLDRDMVPFFAREPDKWSYHFRCEAAWLANDILEARCAQIPEEERLRRERHNWTANMPQVQPYGVSDAGAERLARDWMRFMDIRDAEVTTYVNDGGIDVTSATHIAQVKNYAKNRTIGVGEMREFAGVVMLDGRAGLFFTSAAYGAGAIDIAERANIGLFTYDVEMGSLDGRDGPADVLIKWGPGGRPG